ncbi:MAG: type II toxin-antitoxin system RelE/ParE family toxin [Thermoanaerobaculia bacterium]|nr:type II toxin-antitoxin system RelE/ParE family toxin [Thermoanaerobaculia bacterium]
MPRLRWTHRSRRDLLEIGRFIARDKPGAARRWVARLRRRAQQAAEYPDSGRIVPELGRDDLREVVERGYRIIYRISDREIHVLTVFESHRLLRTRELEESDS